jgi:hypothetical protein
MAASAMNMPSHQRKNQSVLYDLVDEGAEAGLELAVHDRGALVADAVVGIVDATMHRSGRSHRLAAGLPRDRRRRAAVAPGDTGKPMRQLLREWITAPLRIDGDLYFGVPGTDLPRLARLDTFTAGWAGAAAASVPTTRA